VHLDEEGIQRLLHDELTPPVAASAREHVAACDVCRARLTEAEREESWVFDQLTHLDHPPPPVQASQTMVGGRGPAWGRWAAGILLLVGVAGAAYAAPGSPLPRLVQRVTQWLADTQPPVATEDTRPAAETAPQGIAVPPGDRFTILFSTEQRGGGAMVSLTDGSEVVVRAIGGPVTFTSDADTLSVDNTSRTVRFDLEIPRRAPHVEIWVGGYRVFSKKGSQIVSRGRRQSADRYLIPFFRAAR
jgi:hypothetical protein